MDYNGRRLRHEQKYYISYGEYYNLVSKLSAVLKRDGNYGDKGYFIRSLYFDDMYNSSYYEKEAGNFTRSKYRIRIYNLFRQIRGYKAGTEVQDRSLYFQKLACYKQGSVLRYH